MDKNVVTQAFAGHIGKVELAAVSIANTVDVIVGFNFGLVVLLAVFSSIDFRSLLVTILHTDRYTSFVHYCVSVSTYMY